MNHTDVLIVGAGLSGIGAAWHLQDKCPDRSYTILEGRETLGGTWDLFRYPGIRSDSDMYTLGYAFKPWSNPKAIADGPSILEYVRETAEENGIDRHIQYGHLVKRAAWDSDLAQWTVEAERSEDGERVQFTCSFLYLCSGYYDYDAGYLPDFPGADQFTGPLIHPQHWPEDLDYAGKRVVIIGSGATAVTLVPEMAKTAAHVTMLQRSPTYVVSAPAEDKLANWLRRHLAPKVAYGITRWKNVLLGMAFFRYCRGAPEKAKAMLVNGVRAELGDDYDVDTHFNPGYYPWDQRLCLVPDADLFKSIRDGSSSVVTDHIETFTQGGIQLTSGDHLDADIIVSATGLQLKVMAGIEFSVDGVAVNLPECMTYKGMMISGVPNLAMAMGYTNASWTLKADLTSAYVCRLLNHMARAGVAEARPVVTDPDMAEEPLMDFSSGYVQRSIDAFPKQGSKAPWRLYQNYAFDLVALGYGKVDDDAMQFSTPVRTRRADAA